MKVQRNAVNQTSSKRMGPDSTLQNLARRVSVDIDGLLKKERAGTLTQLKLDAELKEVKRRMKKLNIHVHRIC